MKNLPEWRLTNRFPAFYDTESGSSIEMTAKVYGAMKELINEYNQFVIDLTKQITEFEGGTIAEIEAFKQCISETFTNYAKTIDTKISLLELKLDNLPSTLEVVEEYNDETESMDLIVRVRGDNQ